MNSFDFFNKISICPDCFDKFKTEENLKPHEQGYRCLRCQKTYPIKKVVYIREDKCNPKKCNWECKKACGQNAISKFSIRNKSYFTLSSIIKNSKNAKVSINENCNNCLDCVKKCPLKAITDIATPIFLISESIGCAPLETTENKNKETINIQLRQPLKKKGVRPIIQLLYEEIINEVQSLEKKSKINLIVDNGCGTNLLKMFIPDREILSLDINTDHNAFYPLHAVANGEHLPLEKQSVDLFVSINVLEHVTNPSNYLGEIKRTLKESGKLIIALPTPWWHMGKLLSLHHHFNYWLHILKNPFDFLKNPLRDFDRFWAHEKDCNYEGTKQTITLSKEIKNFSAKNWEKFFSDCGLVIEKKLNIGNVFSNNVLATNFTKKIGNSSKRPIHFMYLLKKYEGRQS